VPGLGHEGGRSKHHATAAQVSASGLTYYTGAKADKLKASSIALTKDTSSRHLHYSHTALAHMLHAAHSYSACFSSCVGCLQLPT
jgi:hypothetical protein